MIAQPKLGWLRWGNIGCPVRRRCSSTASTSRWITSVTLPPPCGFTNSFTLVAHRWIGFFSNRSEISSLGIIKNSFGFSNSLRYSSSGLSRTWVAPLSSRVCTHSAPKRARYLSSAATPPLDFATSTHLPPSWRMLWSEIARKL
ncbi:MAG: hypothetical protein K0Q72_5406 [Armatimonadetes bacterium]|nr:hypothetical protein [Armatimonadota bacterium]